MAEDKSETLELLRSHLNLIEKGGCGGSIKNRLRQLLTLSSTFDPSWIDRN